MPANRVTSKSPWHIVLVLDDSGSMMGKPASDVNEAIGELIDTLVTTSMGQKPYFKVSVISFGSNFSTLAEAVPETDLDENKVARFKGASGSTNIASALDEVARVLKANPGQANDFEPFIFVLSDGYPDDRPSALAAADRVKGLSLPSGTPRLITLGFGNVDHDFMQKVATNSELYKQLDESSDIVRLLPTIGTMGSSGGGAEKVEESIMIF